MKGNETSTSTHVLKKSQPEESDLVILCGGTASTVADKRSPDLSRMS
jgi:hypothetical protein